MVLWSDSVTATVCRLVFKLICLLRKLWCHMRYEEYFLNLSIFVLFIFVSWQQNVIVLH